MDKGSYNLAFGSVELPRPAGKPQVFVVAGGGSGIPCFRALQKQQLPFAAGILFENDIDFQVARQLAGQVVSAPAFEPISPALYRRAARLLLDCGRVLDAGTPAGSLNQPNRRLWSWPPAGASRRSLFLCPDRKEPSVCAPFPVSSSPEPAAAAAKPPSPAPFCMHW